MTSINNREIITDIDNVIQKNKSNFTEATQAVKEYITSKNITNIETIIDDRDSTTLAQFYLFKPKPDIEGFSIIVKVYQDLLKENNDAFISWILHMNDSNSNIFDNSSERGELEIFKSLIDLLMNEAYHLIDKLFETDGQNVFHIAAKSNKTLSILFYYFILSKDQKNYINKKDKTGSTPLSLACYYDNVEVSNILIELGCELNTQNSVGNTPLHIATEHRNVSLVKKLVLHGADKNIVGQFDRIPYQTALNVQNKEILEVLQQRNIIKTILTCQIEFTTLKNRRKDILLLSILLVLIVLQLLFSLWANIPNRSNYIKPLFTTFIVDQILSILSIAFELICIMVVFWFNRYHKNQTKISNEVALMNYSAIDSERHSKSVVSDLTVITEQAFGIDKKIALNNILNDFSGNKKICVKCLMPKEDTTCHCVACDRCVKNYDHHCLWLNTCICKDNMCAFTIFVSLIIMAMFLNLLDGIIYMIYICDKEQFSKVIEYFFGITNFSNIIVRIILIIVLGLYTFIMMILFLTSVIPFFCMRCESKSRKAQINDKANDKIVALVD